MNLNEQPPKGYYIQDNPLFGDILVHGNEGEEDSVTEFFRISKRHFFATDHYLGYMPSQLIEYLTVKRKEPVTVADIGGGRESLCASDIADKYGVDVRVVNFDLLHYAPSLPTNTSRVRADIYHIPLASESIDFALSYQVFPFLENDGEYTKGILAIKEVGRVLRTGGIAIIDESYVSSLPWSSDQLHQLTKQTGCFLGGGSGNCSEPGEVVFGGLSPRFLLMIKEPFDYDVFSIQPKIIGQI